MTFLPITWRELVEQCNERTLVGHPGVRDPAHPCDGYEPGAPAGNCEPDGHYLCRGCTQCDLAAWRKLKEGS